MEIKDLNTIKTVSIVLTGNFNPPIFHPEWFDRNQLLPPNEVRDISKVSEVKTDLNDSETQKIKFISSNVFISGLQTRLLLPSYRVEVSPDRFEARTSINSKFEELIKFVCATFKILEHTPIQSLGINFLSSLEFSQDPTFIMHNLFCHSTDKMKSLFNEHYLIDSRIRYDFKDSKVTLITENKDTKIGFNFNYNKILAEKNGTKEVIDYILTNFDLMMFNADEVIRKLFGDPIKGDNNE